MKMWEHSEILLLQGNLHLGTSEIFLKYCEANGPKARTYDSVQKKVKKLREAFSDQDDDTGESIEAQILSTPFLPDPDIRAKVKQEREEAGEWLQNLMDVTSNYRWSNEVKPHPVESEKSSLVVAVTDTHFGKQTECYNLEVARRRMVSIPGNIAAKELPSLDEVVILLGGDMIEGEDIFPNQNSNVECSALEQMMECSEAIWEMILGFRRVFEVPVRVITVPGNHGRVSKTANSKTNWDNVIYHVIRSTALRSGDKDIRIDANFEKFKTFAVKGHRGLLYHKGVKHTGTPAMREKVAGWAKGKDIDFLVHGHWHEWHVGNWLGKFVIANGCMCGPDDLAEEMAKEDTARQAFFFVTPGEPAWGFSFVEWQDDES
ncbi:MAG: metallophosphoesterase [Candidatus Bathyarchaeota archaeon]|nr:metallophosphoesterase [Candidatus Bathyarchaeota archaeon]